MFFLDVSV